MPNLTDDPFVALGSPPSAALPVAYRLQFALHAAVAAPSVHNTQPWRFRVAAGPLPHVDLLLDPSRELPALDPTHRQLVISCGAALAGFELGLRSCGLEPHVELLPAGGGDSCLARVGVTDRNHADARSAHLLPALRHRRSYRGAMTTERVAPVLCDELMDIVEGKDDTCRLLLVSDDRWRAVEHLVVQAAIELSDTTDVDRETRDWTRLTERASDGVPAANWQRTSEQTAGAPVVQRDFAQGRPLPEQGQPEQPGGPEGDPLIAVLLSPADTSRDWIETGRALLRLSLAAEEAGLALGYVNQPTEVPGLREELEQLLSPLPQGFAVPQLVLRLGYPAQSMPPVTPRRPVADVLLDS
jgi:nitroreductase